MRIYGPFTLHVDVIAVYIWKRQGCLIQYAAHGWPSTLLFASPPLRHHVIKGVEHGGDDVTEVGDNLVHQRFAENLGVVTAR